MAHGSAFDGWAAPLIENYLLRRYIARMRTPSFILPPRPRSVLVVDDCEAVLAVVRSMLENLGFEDVCEAADGEAALAYLKERPVDLVISDWSMPRMSGFELLRAIRSDEALNSISFVMMTTPSKAARLLWAKAAGVDNCILKPFTPQMLHGKLAAICCL